MTKAIMNPKEYKADRYRERHGGHDMFDFAANIRNLENDFADKERKDVGADADSIKKREERMLDATFGDVDESMMDEDRRINREIRRDIFSMVPWTPLRGVDRRR